MAKTLIDIPDELMRDARNALGPGTTKAEAVREGLRVLVRTARQREGIRWLAEEDPLADLRDDEVRAGARR
jgi:Arc/MetJ family transcription regulator